MVSSTGSACLNNAMGNAETTRESAGLDQSTHCGRPKAPDYFTPITVEANVPGIPVGWRNIVTTLRTVTEKASELGEQAKDSLEELGRSAGRKLDEAREDAGDALHSAA